MIFADKTRFLDAKVQTGCVYTIRIVKAPAVSVDLFFAEKPSQDKTFSQTEKFKGFNLPLLLLGGESTNAYYDDKEDMLVFLYENKFIYVYEVFLARLVEFGYIEIVKLE